MTPHILNFPPKDMQKESEFKSYPLPSDGAASSEAQHLIKSERSSDTDSHIGYNVGTLNSDENHTQQHNSSNSQGQDLEDHSVYKDNEPEQQEPFLKSSNNGCFSPKTQCFPVDSSESERNEKKIFRKLDIQTKAGLICLIFNVTNFSEKIKKINGKDNKNFPKCLGDKFAAMLSNSRIELPKDVLDSCKYWNAVFNREERGNIVSKGNKKKLLEALAELDEKGFTCHTWVVLFLRFLSDFDPQGFRNEGRCQANTPEKRLLYEIISESMQFAGSVLDEILALSNCVITTFRILKMNKEKVKIGFSTGSPKDDKILMNVIKAATLTTSQKEETYDDMMKPETFSKSTRNIEEEVKIDAAQEANQSFDFSESNLLHFEKSENMFGFNQGPSNENIHYEENLMRYVLDNSEVPLPINFNNLEEAMSFELPQDSFILNNENEIGRNPWGQQNLLNDGYNDPDAFIGFSEERRFHNLCSDENENLAVDDHYLEGNDGNTNLIKNFDFLYGMDLS